jgi:GT2 family glycosyltransferase
VIRDQVSEEEVSDVPSDRPSLTIAIASYQRKVDVVRLLRGIQELAGQSPESWQGVDVVVVLDGSTDGSAEAVTEVTLPIPLTTIWQENAGLSAARNAGLKAAKGEVIWFLDDDLLPLPGTLERHRSAHDGRSNVMLLGPCDVAPEIDLYPAAREFWIEHNALRAEGDHVDRFDLIAIANASISTHLLRSVGGFDERFVGYGLEDFELALRLLETDLTVKFDVEAICWHYSANTERLERLRRRETGRNTVRFIAIHPEIADHFFPEDYPRRSMQLVDRTRLKSPRLLMLISEVAAGANAVTSRLIGKGYTLRMLSLDASFAAGIADVDPSLVNRAMGRPHSDHSQGIGTTAPLREQ